MFCVSSLAACQAPKPDLTGAGMNMFAPVKIRLHPLSRIIPAEKETPASVEARLEFTDQFGDISKSVGTARFELFAYDPIAIAHEGKRLGQWDESLTTPDDNRNHWDAITRTYLFKISPDGSIAGHDRVVLAATFTLPNGEKLSDEIILPSK
jgi:hypothetical protein